MKKKSKLLIIISTCHYLIHVNISFSIRLKSELSEMNKKLTHALQVKAAAESKLADFEKEKMMIELDVKETIARHKTDVTERMAWAAKV